MLSSCTVAALLFLDHLMVDQAMIPLQVYRSGAVTVFAEKLAVPLLPVGAFVRLLFRLSAGALLAGRADVVGCQDVMLLASALPDHILISLEDAAPLPLPKQLVVVGVSSENNQLKFPIETSEKYDALLNDDK